MVFPYMDHDLCGLLANSDFKLTNSIAKLLMKQILQGMDYIHAVCPFSRLPPASILLGSARLRLFGANDRTTSFIEISRLRIFSWAVAERSKSPISVSRGHGHSTSSCLNISLRSTQIWLLRGGIVLQNYFWGIGTMVQPSTCGL